ncbi:putative zinc ribbon protein [Enterobacter asburiae]|uniref:putative zinc ribbon protein n=1 Tax=Enterobacter asburiae TaxID=61645 RepID=UPI003F553CAB
MIDQSGIRTWYSVWCGEHYLGVKHSPRCMTGIYSIEEAHWRTNYRSNTLTG